MPDRHPGHPPSPEPGRLKPNSPGTESARSGAHDVIDRSKPLVDELKRIGVERVALVASLSQTEQHYRKLIEVLAPQGRFALIDDPATLDAMPLKRKSISLHWEMMFTCSLFETLDMQRQHDILNRVSELVNAGTIRTTLAEHFGRISAVNLRRAHALIESGQPRDDSAPQLRRQTV